MSLEIRTSPSGPLVGTVDPSFNPMPRVAYVDQATEVPIDEQNGSSVLPFSSLTAAVAALVLTGGIIVAAPGDYSGEATLELGSQNFTITSQDPHAGYAFASTAAGEVRVPTINCDFTLNLVSVRAMGAITCGALQVDACFMEAPISTGAMDGYDTQFSAAATIGALGFSFVDCRFTAANITHVGTIARFIDCTFVSSFTITFTGAAGSVIVDSYTNSFLQSIPSTITNGTIVLQASTGQTGTQQILSPSGTVGVVDLTSMPCGGCLVLQPGADATIEQFTAKSNGFWFECFFDSNTSTFIVTFPHETGGTSTQRIRTPNSVNFGMQRNQLVRFRYQFNRWRLQHTGSTPQNVGLLLSNMALPFVVYPAAFAAGGGGAPDDVTLQAAMPFAARIIDVWLDVATAVGGSTCTLRNATGGGGAALSQALSSAATGTVRNNVTASSTIAAGAPLVLRRSDNGVAGEVFVLALRTG